MPDRMLDRSSFSMRLWCKARIDGAWNPGDIDFQTDRSSWDSLPAAAKKSLRYVCRLFLVGERAVTLNLLPLLRVIASEQRIEEELYLTSFLADEAKHVDFFCRVIENVAGQPDEPLPSGGYLYILDTELKTALARLDTDCSPEAQVCAAVTYHIGVEGIMAETGRYLLHRMISSRRVLPGVQTGLQYLHRDESRHIAYGLYLLSRLIAQHGNIAYKAFLDRMSELKPLIETASGEFIGYPDQESAFGISREELVGYSQRQFASRVQRILRARTQSLSEIEKEDTP